MISVTESTFRHPRVLRQTFVTIGGLGWQVSSVRLVKTEAEAENYIELFAVARDAVHKIDELYELLIFKTVNGARHGPQDYGHYRSDKKDEVLRAHEAIVKAISSGIFKPVTTSLEEFNAKSSNLVAEIVELEENI